MSQEGVRIQRCCTQLANGIAMEGDLRGIELRGRT